MREHHRDVCDWLRGIGADEVRLEHGGRGHPRVRFRYQGAERAYIISGTPTGLYAASAAIRDLRHMLGLVDVEKRTGERRKRRARASEGAAPCPVLTPGRDWTLALLSHPLGQEAFRKRLDEAWLGLWRDAMRSVGARSRL